MVRLAVKLPDELIKRAKARAAIEGKSLARLLAEITEEYLKKVER